MASYLRPLRTYSALVLCAPLLTIACGGDDDDKKPGSGGSAGVAGSGGSAATGGTAATGGNGAFGGTAGVGAFGGSAGVGAVGGSGGVGGSTGGVGGSTAGVGGVGGSTAGAGGVGGSTAGVGGVGGSTGGAGGVGGSAAGAGGVGGSTAGVGGVGGSTAGAGGVGGSTTAGAGGVGGSTGGAGGVGGSTGGVGGSTGGTGGSTGGAGGVGGSTAGTGGVGGAAGGAGGVGGAGGTGGTGPVTPNLYFSEYIEGSGTNNKALEIYNAGPPQDLSECQVRIYVNGSSTPDTPATLSGTLGTGEVYTLCRAANIGGGGLCDQVSAVVANFNGDDALELVCNGQVHDVFGTIGQDPGAAWIGGGVRTSDRTLLRKCSVTQGNPAGFTNPSLEWEELPQDTFTNLGRNTCVANTLKPGQLVLTGMRTQDPDHFAFGFLVDVGPGTEILFTDNRWNAATGLASSEGTAQVILNQLIPAGTVVRVNGLTASSPDVSVLRNTTNFSTSGDQILAYQGTAAAPWFLFALSCATDVGFVDGASSSHQTELPPELAAAFVEIPALGPNCNYSGARSGLAFPAYLSPITTASQWDAVSDPGGPNPIFELDITPFTN
ncbi:MAG: hypothetical protein KIT72_12455 [Polyangiaceae bacterium]|nr:hypothetical protein [Polyangiaceae bacterium]MCW5791225.1 hypothetical protein [Polyangiaceae bacterium]